MRQPFGQRLKEAAIYAGVEYSPAAIGRALGVHRQTVFKWMDGGEPRGAMVFRIADLWNVDPRWLATGEGSMMPPPSSGSGLSADELEMIKRYRKAEPRTRASLIAIAKTFGKAASIALLSVGVLGFNNNGFAASFPSAPLEGNRAPSRGHEYTLRSFVAMMRRFCRRAAFAMLNADKVITA